MCAGGINVEHACLEAGPQLDEPRREPRRLRPRAAVAEGGDEALTDIKGIGAKTAVDIKKGLRSRGFELPEQA